MDYFVWFNVEQGVEHRYGYLQMSIQPTPEIMRQAISATIKLDPKLHLDTTQPIILTWRELTREEYDKERGRDIRQLGPPTFTNANDEQRKMN